VGNGEGEGERCTAERGKWGKSDLKKNCSRWPKTEYVRTYRSTFERTGVRSTVLVQVRGCVCA
jgi:hypothetical protein